LIDAADPGKFSHIEGRFLTAQELIQVYAAPRHAQSQTVRFRDAVYVIGGAERSRAGHVLHDDVGIAGYVLAHVAGENSRVLIVQAAGSKTDDDANGFVFVKRRWLRMHLADHSYQNR
jgi:hypothetical protein